MQYIHEKEVAAVFAPRPRLSHKGNFGTVALCGGSVHYNGAVKLANMAAAAMRGGAGVVRLMVPDTLTTAVMPYLLESTLFPYHIDDAEPHLQELSAGLTGVRAVGCGMGWSGDETEHQVLSHILRETACPVLLDAGALRLMAREPELFRRAEGPLVLTPHPGEFSQLVGCSIQEVLAQPVVLAMQYAKAHACVVILKGSATLVTDGDICYEVDRGGAGMATAGSGDVLAGVLTGMLGYLAPTPLHLAAGVYLTGLAGEIAEESHPDITMVASDTISALPQALLRVRG